VATIRTWLEDFSRLDDSLATLCSAARAEMVDLATSRLANLSGPIEARTRQRELWGSRWSRTAIVPKAMAFSVVLLVALAAFSPNRPAHAPRGFSTSQRPKLESPGGLGLAGGLLLAASSGQLQRPDLSGESRSGTDVGSPDQLPKETASRSIVSCLFIADQFPGVPPIRRSAATTIDWIRQAIPAPPQLPPLPQWLPDFSLRASPERWNVA
jgi:hypothetical protein